LLRGIRSWSNMRQNDTPKGGNCHEVCRRSSSK